ncbi:MAG: hypothetical protein JRI59_04780 [Deltaproteobacteria bacterium]|nr:hypothetical protein [Deltaproteobacteria bacterium]
MGNLFKRPRYITVNPVNLLKAAVMLLCLVLYVTASARAQGGARLHYSKMFNPRTVGSVSGEVVQVDQVLSGSGLDYCTHALLKTPQGYVTAILAPKSFMEEKGLTLAPGDRVTVKGSMISIRNRPFILVMEVTGDRTMKLRDAEGRPAWAVGDDWHAR